MKPEFQKKTLYSHLKLFNPLSDLIDVQMRTDRLFWIALQYLFLILVLTQRISGKETIKDSVFRKHEITFKLFFGVDLEP